MGLNTITIYDTENEEYEYNNVLTERIQKIIEMIKNKIEENDYVEFNFGEGTYLIKKQKDIKEIRIEKQEREI